MVDNIYNQAMGGLLHIFEPYIGLGPYIGESTYITPTELQYGGERGPDRAQYNS